MKFKTPDFWYQTDDRMPALLRIFSPLGALYGWGTYLQQKFTRAVIVDIPVICVGNLVAGGSGKTPVALALLSLLKDSGITRNPCFLTRGYGGTLKGPVFVSQHDYKDVGDESLLLSRTAPTIVSRDRIAGACLAVSSGHDLIIMDDGFQNASLHKSVSLVVVDGRTGFGNGRLLPFGPLREPFMRGLSRADAVIKIGDGPSIHTGKPVMAAHLKALSAFNQGYRVYGFCGLGQPEKFKKTLIDMGVDLTGFESFPDHHPYSSNDIQRLQVTAQQHKAQLVTTEKDTCRLPSPDPDNIQTVKVKIVFENPEALLSLIRACL